MDYFRLAAKWLPKISWALFLISLLLPATEIQMFQKPTIIHGWQASICALASINMLLREPLWIAFPLAALGNVFVLIAPWFINRSQTKQKVVGFGLGLAICTACALSAPLLLAKFSPTLRIGYYLWIAALLLSLMAAMIKLAQLNAQTRPVEEFQDPVNDRKTEIR